MKIFQREQRSLVGEILDWMLTPLLLLWPVSLALTWLVAQGLANKPFDRALEYNAHALAQLVGVAGNKVQFNLPQPASEILRADESDIVYYQVLGPGGEFLSGERELVFQPFYRALGSEADGSGLGLPIVLEIARKHDAEVTLEDARPGQQPPGARFSVRFAARDEVAGG